MTLKSTEEDVLETPKMATSRRSSHKNKHKIMCFICSIFSQIDENYPVETEFLRVFANDSDVGLVTIQFVNFKGW